MYGHHSIAAKKLSAMPRPGFRGGGLIRGPGTGTSDSIPAEVPAGTYILPRDTTEATGLAARTLGDVPVALSNGEYEITPEQVQAIGASVLDILRGVTHEPVGEEDRQAFADGGVVNDVTRTGNSYSGGNVGGNITVNGQSPGGTFSQVPTVGASPAPAPAVAAPSPAVAAAPTASVPAAAPAPAAPMGWAERNAQRSLEVSASSIMPSAEREAAQSKLASMSQPAPAPAAAPFSAAPPAPVGAAGVLGQVPQPVLAGARPPSVLGQRPGFANGGMVQADERRRALIDQIPIGDQTAPAADGSQNNPLNTELGRNAVNTLSALPGVTGLAARTAGGAARGASAALSTERVIPAAWEVVQDGGALASRAATPSGGALTRAAALTPEVSAVGVPGRAAQMLGAPPGQLAQRAASGVGDAIPAAGSAARSATPYADIVEPLAFGASGAGQAANAAGQGAIGLGRVAAAGGAAGLGAAALLAGDSSAGSPAAAASTAPGATPPATAQPRATAAETLMGPPMSASNSITRDGNSYSGPANISGDVSIRNPDGSLRAPASVSTLPSGGGISVQNMAAADALASRENAASLGRLGLAGGAPGFSGVIGQQSGNGNMWSRTPEQQRRDAEVQASSIHRPTAALGAGLLQAQDAQALQGIKSQADIGVAQLQDQGLFNRTLITERGNNTRAAIDAQGRVTAAGIKAAQEAALARQKQAEKNPETSMALRKEFEGLPEVKNYKQALPAFKGIEDAVKRDTPMSDINIVYGIAKLYDPNSVVREGEYATVANAPGMPDRIKGWANYVRGGGKLTADVKKQIMDEASSRMLSFQNEFEGTQKRYNDIAARSNADPTLVTVQGYQPAVQKQGGSPAASRPVGTTSTVNGKTAVWDGSKWNPQ